MGYLIEYFASVQESAVRRWLDRLSGFFCSDPGEMPIAWEGSLHSGGTFWAHFTSETCHFSLAMNSSCLFQQQPQAIDCAQRFEGEFWAEFGHVPLLRLDEFLLNQWGVAWESCKHPIEELRAWLMHCDSHWDWLDPAAMQISPAISPP